MRRWLYCYVRWSSTNKRVLESSVKGQIVRAWLFVVLGAVDITNCAWNLCILRVGRASCKCEGCREPYGGRAWLRWAIADANSCCYREFQDSRLEGEYSSSHELWRMRVHMVARVSYQLSRLGIRTKGFEQTQMLGGGRDHLSASCGDSCEAVEYEWTNVFIHCSDWCTRMTWMYRIINWGWLKGANLCLSAPVTTRGELVLSSSLSTIRRRGLERKQHRMSFGVLWSESWTAGRLIFKF